MSTVRNLPKESWQSYFNSVSSELAGKRAEVEVASLELGDQIIGEWLPLTGITYDSRDDLVDVSLAGLTHMIRRPTQIEVTEDETGIQSVAITSGDGTLQVLRLKEPLAVASAGI